MILSWVETVPLTDHAAGNQDCWAERAGQTGIIRTSSISQDPRRVVNPLRDRGADSRPAARDSAGEAAWRWAVRRWMSLACCGMTTPLVTPTPPPSFWGRNSKGDGYRAATVCRRRHEHDLSLEIYPGNNLGFCAKCGAQVLPACPNCHKRLRGTVRTVTPPPGRPPAYEPHPWGFCDGCGEPYPWANREEIISQLQNILDQEDAVSEHDRLTIMEDLERLKTLDPGEDPKTERRLLASVKKGLPRFTRGLGAELLTKLIAEATFS
jgi:hypothetical protein